MLAGSATSPSTAPAPAAASRARASALRARPRHLLAELVQSPHDRAADIAGRADHQNPHDTLLRCGQRPTFFSASLTSASRLAPSPSSSTAAATAALASPATKAEIGERRQRIGRGTPGGDRRGTGRADRDRTDLVLQFVDDPHRQLGADAVGAGNHRLVAARDRPAQFDRVEHRQDRQRDPAADALDPGQQPEPVALGGGGEAEQGDRILAHLHFGEQQRRFADRPDRRQCPRRGLDEIADPADIDHQMVDPAFDQPSRQPRDHATRSRALALAR